MVSSFRNRQLSALWRGKQTKIDSRFHKRILTRLDAIDTANAVEELNLPGYKFHSLQGFSPTRYTIHVNGPWCLTFEFYDGDAHNVDFEQYH
ncbi:MAG: type II toxin-antitoxin system RelE/ParE family toxin [Pseudomonadota bacterium]